MRFAAKDMIPKDLSRRAQKVLVSSSGTSSDPDTSSEEALSSEESNMCSNTISVKNNKKPIKHKEFINAIEHVNDRYWRDQLILASRDIFSYGITYDGKCLIKKDAEVMKNLGNNSKTLAKRFIEFHRIHDHAMSERDVKEKEDARTVILEQVMVWNWMESSNKMRKAALYDYALNLKKTTNMSSQSYNSLAVCIHWAIGCIDETDVIVENGVITKLNFVGYNKDTDIWYNRHGIGNGGGGKAKSRGRTPKVLTADTMWEDFAEIHAALVEHEEKLRVDHKKSAKGKDRDSKSAKV
jgi:hypothetical protein